MLRIDNRRRWRVWKEAGVSLLMSPLTPEKDREFVDATTTYVRDDDGRVTDVKRDVREYNRLVGRECVHDWKGVVHEVAENTCEPLDFSPEALDAFMTLEPASNYVFNEAKGLGMHLVREIKAAGNA